MLSLDGKPLKSNTPTSRDTEGRRVTQPCPHTRTAKTRMAPNEPVEVELKLLLPEHARAALERHPALQAPCATAPETRQEHTVYFDTPLLSLAGKGLSLRVRRCGDARVQTLKSAGDGYTVAASRGEWEWRIDQDVPDLSCVAETPFGAEIAAEGASGLQPVFETDIRRTVRSLRLAGETVAEAAIDVGRVFAGEATQDVNELELELKRGAPGPLYRLALDLHATVPFIIGVESKAQRGQRLRTGKAAVAVKRGPPPLDRDGPASEAVRRIIGAAIGQLLANQPAAAAGDVEGVHQMRVGIRRLRTALALFGKHLEPYASRHFEAELKRLGQVFGNARDWDVFCTQILPDAEKDEIAKGWMELLRTPAEASRQVAHRELEEEFTRPAITALVLGMAAWLEPDDAGSPVAGDDALNRPIRKPAHALLDRMARRVARGGHPRRRSAEELHALRKALKKLRYSGDYLAAIYPPKPVKQYQKASKRLLKLLGTGTDAAMATRLAGRLCAGARSEVAPAAAALVQWNG